jgi:sugar diacid utilization regulator
MGKRLLSRTQIVNSAGIKAFEFCLKEIMDGKISGGVAVRSTLNSLRYPIKQFVRLGLVTFRDSFGSIPYNYLLARLRELFPEINIAVYERDIVLLLTHDQRDQYPDIEQMSTLLNELLEHYGGLLMFGNATRQLGALRPIYLLLKRTAQLALKTMDENKRHVRRFDDYCTDSLIELAVERYQEIENGADVAYLTHPAITQLIRYDHQHGTALWETFYAYLLHERNLIKTAAAIQTHRNTVLNRINKITSLIRLDLEDPKLRQHLLLSCQITNYYEMVMKAGKS